MELALTSEETILLENVLGEYLSDLRMEIGSTRDFTFRQQLKHKEELLKGLLHKIEESGVVVAD